MSAWISANLPYLLAGISVGGQYALIAIGYTMVYGILRLINFAHGDVFMVAGLIMVYATASLPIYISVILVVVATVLLGVVIEKVAYKPLRSAPRMSVMISAIGVSYLLQNCALYFTGGLPQVYPNIPFLSKVVQVGPATTKMVTIVTPILTLVLVFALVALIKYTKVGMAMRAVSRDFETSEQAWEIKATLSRTRNEVTIHGASQLSTPDDRPLSLIFCRLEESPQGESIDDLAQELPGLGIDAEALEAALYKLGLRQGAIPRRRTFRLMEMNSYPVDEGFPRITKESFVGGELPDGILGLEYTVDLSNLEHTTLTE